MQEAELEGDPVNRMRLEQLHPERFSSVLILADESARVSASVQVRVHTHGLPLPAPIRSHLISKPICSLAHTVASPILVSVHVPPAAQAC